MNRRTVAVVLLLLISAVVVFSPNISSTDHTYQNLPMENPAQNSGLVTATSIEQDSEDHWMILETPLESGNPTVFEYTGSWIPTGNSYTITAAAVDRNGTILPMDVSQQPNGNWYVLDRNNTIYVFDEHWEYTGRTIRLPRHSGWTLSRKSSAFERTTDGWWVDAYGRLTLYDENFDRIVASYDGYQDLELGREYYNSYYGMMTVGDITSIQVDKSGTIWLRASLGDKTYKFSGVDNDGLDSTAPDAVFTLRKNPRYANDIDASGSTRYVLRGNGNLYTYSQDWIYTGTVRKVGSSYTSDRYPPDVVSPAILIIPLLSLTSRLIPIVVIVLMLWIGNRRTEDSQDLYVPAVISACITYTFFYPPYPLRPFLFVHPAVLTVSLLGIVVTIGYHQRIKIRLIPWVLLVYTPVIIKTAEMGLTVLGLYISLPV